MSKSWLWEAMRKKNPLIKRNATITAFGEEWRIANVDSNGHVVLRKEITVHHADIKPLQNQFVCPRYYIVDANERRMEDSQGNKFTEETVEACETIIAYYFDMDYGDRFGVVNTHTAETRWIEREVYEDPADEAVH